MQEYPDTGKPWAVICRTEPNEVTVHRLKEEIPVVVQSDDEILVALATRSLWHEDWETAVCLSEVAARQKPDWAAPALILGQAKLQQAIQNAYQPAIGPPVIADGVLDEPLRLLDEAVAIAERTGNSYLLIQALIERARAKKFAGDEEGASRDIERAYQDRPSDPITVARYGQWLFTHDQTDAAVPLLRKAVALGAGPDADFLLAVALRTKEGTESAAEWLGLAEQAAKNPACSSRTHALELTLDAYIDNRQFDQAEVLVNELSGKGLSQCAVEAGHSRIAFARGEKESATRHAALALAASKDNVSQSDRRFLADTLVKIGEYESSLTEWQAVTSASRQITDAWALVDVAKRMDRPNVILDVAREWRRVGVRDRRLIDEEMALLEKYQPHEAVRVIQEELNDRPDDPYLGCRSWDFA
jgi:tetratricopeptide (TPR) repeat protein